MYNQDDKTTKEPGFLYKLENDLDWNLISIVSVWIFLLSTFFILFI